MKFPYDNDYFPPAPRVDLYLAAPGVSFTIGPLKALVDTGADATLIPSHVIESLDLQIDNRKYLRSQWGERRRVDVYLLDVGIANFRFPAIEIIADEQSAEAIVGRNVLNRLVLLLNGPKQILEI